MYSFFRAVKIDAIILCQFWLGAFPSFFSAYGKGRSICHKLLWGGARLVCNEVQFVNYICLLDEGIFCQTRFPPKEIPTRVRVPHPKKCHPSIAKVLSPFFSRVCWANPYSIFFLSIPEPDSLNSFWVLSLSLTLLSGQPALPVKMGIIVRRSQEESLHPWLGQAGASGEKWWSLVSGLAKKEKRLKEREKSPPLSRFGIRCGSHQKSTYG